MSLRAVVIGGVAWNTMVFLDRFPDPAPQTVFARGMHRAVGSSGAGKALNLRSLGADVALWALIGDDVEGDLIRRRLREASIEFHAEPDPAGTAQHINLMDDAGDRISIFAVAGSLDADVDPSPLLPVMQRADLVSVTIMNHCRPFLELTTEVEADTWIDIHDYDGVNLHHDAFIEAADVLMMSSVAMTDWRRFLEARIESGTKIAIATHGALGASGVTAAEGWIDVPAAQASPVDSNGAGDALMAGFATEWYRSGRLEPALLAGAEHAARAVESGELAPRF